MKCFFFLLTLIMSGCNMINSIDKKLLGSVCEIHIKNRATYRFGGIKEFQIKDKKEIELFYKELLNLKTKNLLPTKPFRGTILIEFMTKDQDGAGEYINVLSTDIVFKPDDKYFIDYWQGQYVSDVFLARVIKYLEIDESKVSALDEYRKSLEEVSSKKEK